MVTNEYDAPQSIASVTELMSCLLLIIKLFHQDKINLLLLLFKTTLLGINKLTKGETIHYIPSMNNEYYYSNNTNIYPLPKNKGSDINAIIEETAYFNKQQTIIFYVSLHF